MAPYPISPEALPTSLLTLTPNPASRRTHTGTAGLLTRRFWGWKSRFLPEGNPRARAEEGVVQGKQESAWWLEPESSEESGPRRQRKTQKKTYPHLITPQSSSRDSLGHAHACRVVLWGVALPTPGAAGGLQTVWPGRDRESRDLSDRA